MPTKPPIRALRMTERWAASVKPAVTQIDWYDLIADGLTLRISPGGAKTWSFRYRRAGKYQRVKLGRFTDAFGVAEARARAAEKQKMVDDGGDPVQARAVAQQAPTFGAIWQKYTALKLPQLAKSTQADYRQRYARRLQTPWATRLAHSITRQEIIDLLDTIVLDEQKRHEANRTQALIAGIFTFAVQRSLVPAHPFTRMPKFGGHEKRRTQKPDLAQLAALMAALTTDGGAAAQAVYVRLLTGQRGGEVHFMRWADVDFRRSLWIVPGERADGSEEGLTKNRRPNTVPLVGVARALLSARAAAPDRDRVRVFPELSHQSKALRKLRALHRGSYRWHDLRRLIETHLVELGIPERVADRLINHKQADDTEGVYNVHQYDLEKRAALVAWDAALRRIAAGGELHRVRWDDLVQAVAMRAPLDWRIGGLLVFTPGERLDDAADVA
jgi:integrase